LSGIFYTLGFEADFGANELAYVVLESMGKSALTALSVCLTYWLEHLKPGKPEEYDVKFWQGPPLLSKSSGLCFWLGSPCFPS